MASKQFSKRGGSNNILLSLILICLIAIIFLTVRSENNLNLPVSSASAGDDIDARIEKFINENPEVIAQSMQRYYQNQTKERYKDRGKKFTERQSDLRADINPYIGNKSAKNTVIEFYDYNCGYCKKALNTIQKVNQDMNDTKVILIDFPILGKSSELLSKASLAAYMLDNSKTMQVHQVLMSAGRVSDEAKVIDILAKIGFDKDKLKSKMNSKEVADRIQRNRTLASELSISGTPAFIINGQFVDGYVTFDEIKKQIK